MSNATALSNAPRFRPPHLRGHSRSPSRSPARKAQFTAQYLDPLLSNLSPDSTLRALQHTQTIPSGHEPDALAESISDASPAEREIGIRAAFSAQKIREWRTEVLAWQWPEPRDRPFGIGFLPPHSANTPAQSGSPVYVGCLPLRLIDQYEQRAEEIKDALESLEMDDIKNHVLEAHTPMREFAYSDTSRKGTGGRKSYGRMRDFTALITATVIQALPELANLNILLDTWDVRLGVLRQLPRMLDVFEATKHGLHAAVTTVRDPDQAFLVTAHDFETTQAIIGEKISDLGRRVDKLLDLLEGFEDALPQAWIDNLENMELEYATWVVDTRNLVLRNEEIQVLQSHEQAPREAIHPEAVGEQIKIMNLVQREHPDSSTSASSQLKVKQDSPTVPGFLNEPRGHLSFSDRKPSLRLDLPAQPGHRKNISEVSAAESMLSNFSELSNAEIVDARSTVVLASPKVSLVENPFRATWYGTDNKAVRTDSRPAIVQRASMASIEVIPKANVKQVLLRRPMSSELLSQGPPSPDSDPRKALEQLTGGTTNTSPRASQPTAIMKESEPWSAVSTQSPGLVSLEDGLPMLPRRSSKRLSLSADTLMRSPRLESTPESVSLNSHNVPLASVATMENSPQKPTTRARAIEPPESLEAKIQDILISLPTKIRLAQENDTNENVQANSTSSTRASTPTAGLMLSPVKSKGRANTGDNDIRLFHLTQQGQPRDAAPVKLFVRAVGENGERVMVRVGGGWADLGEYLREYSLHHGRRGVANGNLELAQYPGTQNDPSSGISLPIIPPLHPKPNTTLHKRQSKSLVTTSADTGEEGSSESYGNGTDRPMRLSSPEPEPLPVAAKNGWLPPPVPTIPATYSTTTQSPTMVTSIYADGRVNSRYIQHDIPTVNDRPRSSPSSPQTQPSFNTSTTFSPITTTKQSLLTPENSIQGKYTPLGAAGPKTSARRAVTYGGVGGGSPAASEAWVQGMVGKARAVSSTVAHGPVTTSTSTTTASNTYLMTPTPTNTNRLSTVPSNAGSTATSSNQIAMTPSPSSSLSKNSLNRPKSRMSMGDISSIKRVFLRRKSSLFDGKS